MLGGKKGAAGPISADFIVVLGCCHALFDAVSGGFPFD